MVTVRPYAASDYPAVSGLYKQPELYGGQFDPDRDSEARLASVTAKDSQAILVAEMEGVIVGTVSLIENERVAWLFRFAVMRGQPATEIAQALLDEASRILKARGHMQVLVYAPAGDADLSGRYDGLGFRKGNDYTCFWKDI